MHQDFRSFNSNENFVFEADPELIEEIKLTFTTSDKPTKIFNLA